VFVNLFGSGFFKVLVSGIDSVNHTIAGALGKDLKLSDLAVRGRSKLLQQFELQSRLPPEKLFAGQEGDLDLHDVKQLYAKYDGGHEVAARVLTHWDRDANGEISVLELQEAASRTDGMVSLGALDPGAGTSLFKMGWELFIVGLVLFFLVSIADQLAKAKQQEVDEARIEELAGSQKSEKKEAKKTK